MELKTKLSKITRVNVKERDSARKGVKALVYNLITEGKYKGWYLVNQLVPPEGIKMSVWTKEQSADLDQRFGKVNGRLDILEKDVKVLKEDVKVLKEDVKVLKEDVRILKEDMIEVKDNVKLILNSIQILTKSVESLNKR